MTSFCIPQSKMTVLPFVVLVIAVLILIPLDPDVKIGDFQPTKYTGKINFHHNSTEYIVQDHYFSTAESGVACHAWLYLPPSSLNDNRTSSSSQTTTNISSNIIITENTRHNDTTGLPVIIMAGGLAEQKDFGLDVYAERFVEEGFAVFLFDYRNFGASEGRPRNLVSPKRHIADWHSAIEYIENSNDLHTIINSNKIGLWGMSFAGGHVLTVSSQRQQRGDDRSNNIVAVVAQAPFLKPRASTKRSSKKRGKLGKLRLVMAALQDSARGRLGLPPLVIRILGINGKLAMMPTTPESFQAYESLRPLQKLGGWINQGPVRGLFELKNYIPFETATNEPPRIPVLLVSGTRDAVCPSDVIAELHDILPKSNVMTRNASHVDIMGPDHAPEVAGDMAKFYAESFQ